MTLPVEINPHLLGGAAGSYQIERSLRFNSADSAYLSRTFTSVGNRKTWTWSAWLKRSFLDTSASSANFQTLFHAGVYSTIAFTANTIYFQIEDGATQRVLQTSQLFRDPSAWYHLVVVLNTPAATASQRMRLYINGTELTAFSTDERSLINISVDSDINNNVPHGIGGNVTPARYFPGYMTEINFIDGSALTPTSFGEYNSETGVWQPIAYTGTYGTNGFYLNFSDNSTTDALGTDFSGNGNTWDDNGFSVTAGAGNDSLVDTPTNYGEDTGVGGEVRGNYATFNPLNQNSTGVTLANGNLDVTRLSSGFGQVWSTIGMSSGKWYVECLVGDVLNFNLGLAAGNMVGGNRYVGQDANTWGYDPSGQKVNSASYASYGNSYTNGDIIGIAFDADAGDLYFYKNGVVQNSGIAAYTGLTSGPYFFTCGVENSTTANSWNFGQRPFAYTAASGFQALVTTNIPAGTVTTSGSFTGNLATDGPFVYLNGVPTAMTINGNAVTFGTHADKLANGFKVRSSSSSYNASGSNTYSVSTTGEVFKNEVAQSNP
jgi:hypothetical protein